MERAMSRSAALGAVGLIAITGCAAPHDPAAPARAAARMTPDQRPDWAIELPELFPAIRACLTTAGRPAVGVTKAWPMAESLAGVRLIAPGGERFDCVAEADGGNVLLTEKVWTVSQLPGEGEPLFTPGSQAQPASSPCIAVSVARDSVGADVGWLSYDVCRLPRTAGPSARNDAQPLSLPPGESG
jgi:hypothetical protein